MRSASFVVTSDAGRTEAIRYVTEELAGQAQLDRHQALRMSLLVEETLGMLQAMVEEFIGKMWFVADKGLCEIHLLAAADMDGGRKRELLSVSTTGKNAAARGFMARIGEFLSRALYSAGKAVDAYGSETIRYGVIGTGGLDTPAGIYDMTPIWTLTNYRSVLEQERGADAAAEAACDELEKSIVASLADEIVVGVAGNKIELVILKKF